jgi:MarR family transcriptional regulator, lower aerobic nicotinate degradation pathway regulator
MGTNASPALAERTELPPAIAERMGFLTGRIHQQMLRLVRQTDAFDEPFTGKHFGCLSVIIDEGPLSQQELGVRICVDRTTVVAVVDDLEHAGFVHRKRNPDDRRAYALEATESGRAWAVEARKAVLEAERELLAPLSAAERNQLVGLMQRLLLG